MWYAYGVLLVCLRPVLGYRRCLWIPLLYSRADCSRRTLTCIIGARCSLAPFPQHCAAHDFAFVAANTQSTQRSQCALATITSLASAGPVPIGLNSVPPQHLYFNVPRPHPPEMVAMPLPNPTYGQRLRDYGPVVSFVHVPVLVPPPTVPIAPPAPVIPALTDVNDVLLTQGLSERLYCSSRHQVRLVMHDEAI